MPSKSRIKKFARLLTGTALIGVLSACGGGGGDQGCVNLDPSRNTNLPSCAPATPSTPSTPSGGTTVTASGVQLLVSSPQVNSDGLSTVDITVVATDANRQGVANRPVQLNVSDPAGTAFVTNFNPAASASGVRTTNANGQLTATLNLGGNKSNRTIKLTATVDQATAANSINVIGTTIAVSGSNALILGSSTQLVVTLNDSSGRPVNNVPVTVTSANGNTVSLSSPTTDSTGRTGALVTATKSGGDTITASANGASTTFALNVSSTNFAFTVPANGTTPQVPINTPQPIAIHWENNGAPVQGSTVTFSITRGSVFPPTATTDASGNASITVSSTSAGPAMITASGGGGATASAGVNFIVNTSPAKIDLQADNTVVSINPAGSAVNAATLTAVVRDSDDNLLQGFTVNFQVLQDPSGGALTAASGTTDVFGQARTQYVPTAVSSPTNGVLISATVVDANGQPIFSSGGVMVQDTVNLTVGGQKLFVRLGTDNLVGSVDTNYTKQYSAFVTDAAGNALSSTPVRFTLRSAQEVPADMVLLTTDLTYAGQYFTRDVNPPAGVLPSTDYAYFKGHYEWTGVVWAPQVLARCFNEDANFNGVLDAGAIVATGEDYNGNGNLDPGNAFSVTPSATTNSAGYAIATITYPKDRANWTRVTLKATALVAGTEATANVTFTLPVAAVDVSDQKVSPPGAFSPYGNTADCRNPQ